MTTTPVDELVEILKSLPPFLERLTAASDDHERDEIFDDMSFDQLIVLLQVINSENKELIAQVVNSEKP